MSRRIPLPVPSAPLASLGAVLLVLLLSLALLPAGTATAAAAVPPGQDFPRMPPSCATVKERIPQKPVICPLTDLRKNRPTIVLWGDSHAWMMIPALKAAIQGRDVNLVATVMGSCPPMDPALTRQTRKQTSSCNRSNDQALRFVRQLKRGNQPVRVVLGGSWQRYLHALRVGDTKSFTGQVAAQMKTQTPRLMRSLAQSRIGTDVVDQVATVPTKRQPCRAGFRPYACDLPRSRALRDETDVQRWLVRTSRPLAGASSLIDVNPYFCTRRVCHGRVDGVRTFFDDLHISASMSRQLRPYYASTVNRLFPRSQQPSSPGSTPQPCPIPLFC